MPARQTGVLEAEILKKGSEKLFFRISASKEPYLRDGDSRRVEMSKVQLVLSSNLHSKYLINNKDCVRNNLVV